MGNYAHVLSFLKEINLCKKVCKISNRNKCENVIAKVMIICNNNRRNKELDTSITIIFDAECPF